MDVDDLIIDPNQLVAYLDQLNVAPSFNHYLSIDKLNSHIAFIAPTNLGSWCYLVLGLQCFNPLPTSIVHPDMKKYIGFFLDDESEKSLAFPHLNEFVSYILAEDLTNPRMEKLSDFHPDHPLKLDILCIRLKIKNVQISQMPEGSTSPACILTLRNDQSSDKREWELVIFNATSVGQIIQNSWGVGTMEQLVTHLVQHGLQFWTLILSNIHAKHLVKNSPELKRFEGIPPIPNIKIQPYICNAAVGHES